MSVNSHDGDDVIVKGVRGGVDREIASTDDNGKERLCVDAKVDGDIVINPITNVPVIHSSVCLMNGAVVNMNVDGSVTPQDFEEGPAAGKLWYVYNICLTIHDNGANDASKFGAILNGLTNGLQVIQDVNSTEYQFTNLKNNINIVNIFATSSHFVGVGSGFINDANLFTGTVELRPGVKLIGDDGDKIIARVRDDLTGLNSLYMRISYWEDIT